MGFKVGSGYLLTALEAAHLRLETVRMDGKSHFVIFRGRGCWRVGVLHPTTPRGAVHPLGCVSSSAGALVSGDPVGQLVGSESWKCPR